VQTRGVDGDARMPFLLVKLPRESLQGNTIRPMSDWGQVVAGANPVSPTQVRGSRWVSPHAGAVALAPREQEIHTAFADHDRRCVGVGARNFRQRRGVGDPEVVHAANP
jgi:hypothetical protein